MIEKTKTYIFELNGHYRPVALLGNCNPQQHSNRTGEFTAYVRRFVIVSATGGTHHGNWINEHEAQKTCASYPRLPNTSPRVEEVAPYWYAPAFGMIENK